MAFPPATICYEGNRSVLDYFSKRLQQDLPLSIPIEDPDTNVVSTERLLNIKFIGSDIKKEQQDEWHLAAHWFKRPCLHIFIVESSGTEIVSKEIRRDIKNWSTEIRDKNEWLVIHVASTPAKKTGISMSIPRGFYDLRSKIEFPKDRYYQIYKKAEQNEDWYELVKRIRECLSVAFSRQLKEYTMEIKNLLDRRLFPGWNFCNYFIVKEGLAFTLVQCNQLKRAYEIYVQLEELYDSLPVENRIENFLGGSAELITEKGELHEWISPLRREEIYQNKISEFRLREYLFARKFFLSLTLQHPLVALRLTIKFLQTMNVKLKENKVIQYPNTQIIQKLMKSNIVSSNSDDNNPERVALMFSCLWSFVAGYSIANARELIDVASHNHREKHPRDNIRFNSLMGDLLYYIRAKLDAFMELCDHLAPSNEGSPILDLIYNKRGKLRDSAINIHENNNRATIDSAIPEEQTSSDAINSSEAEETAPSDATLSEHHENSDSINTTVAQSNETVNDIEPSEDDLSVKQEEISVNLDEQNSKNEEEEGEDVSKSGDEEDSTSTQDSSTINAGPPTPIEPDTPECDVKSSLTPDNNQNTNTNNTSLSVVKETNKIPSINSTDEEVCEPMRNITTTKMAEIISSQKAYDQLYLQVSREAAHHYKAAEYRSRAITRLTLDVANIYFARKQYSEASEQLKKVSIEDGWNKITTDIRMKLAECEHHLQHPEIYITACLGLLGPECDDNIRLFFHDQLEFTATQRLRSFYMRDFYPLIDCRLKFNTKTVYHVGEILTVQCVLHSFLLKPIHFNKLSLSMVNSSPDSFMYGSETIDFTKRKVTLLPGANSMELQAQLPAKGKFVCEYLRLEIGKLVLTQHLRSSYDPISVENSQATLEIEVRMPSCLIVNQIQSLQLVLLTNEDTIQSGSLKISSTDLEIHDLASSTMRITDAHNQVREVEFSCIAGNIQLSSCASHETVELHFPVKALVDTAHEVAILLSYEKSTRETFDITTLVDIHFTTPFQFDHQIIQDTHELYIQVRLTNKTHIPIHIHEHDIIVPRNKQLIGDHNDTLKNSLIYPNRECSWIFVVKDKRASSKDPDSLPLQVPDNNSNFTVHFSPKLDLPSTVMPAFLPSSFATNYSFPIDTPTILYEITAHFPEKGVVGKPIELHVDVRENISELDSRQSKIAYYIDSGSDFWALIGRSKSELKLVEGTATFTVQIIPLTTGWLSVPLVYLENVDEKSVVSHQKMKKIQVVPSGEFCCQCVPKLKGSKIRI